MRYVQFKLPAAAVLGSLLLFLSFNLGAKGLDMAEPNLTERVAAAVVAFDYENIPPEAVAMAGTLIRDNLAVAVGSHDVDVLKTMEQVLDIDGGDYLLLSSGKKAKLLEAVYLNALASNMLDFDDAHTGLGHPGATIVQPALVLAQKYGSSTEELVEAVVAGYEFGIRWAKAAFDYEGKFEGPWSLGNLQSFAAVVTAGKLMDLDETQMARAFFFAAANMPIGTAHKIGINPGQTMNGLKNNYGETAQGMVLAALTAKNGVYSDGTVLDGDQGLWRMVGARAFHEEELLNDLGSRWDILEMQIKPYASCRWSHAAVDGLYELMPQFDLGQVKKINVYTFKFGATAVSGRNPTNMFQMQFSVPHVFAMAMLGESLIYMQESSISNAEVVALSEKIDVHYDQKYEDLFKIGNLPAKVVVELKDGSKLEAEVLVMKGEAANPMERPEHDNKVKVLLDSSPHDNVRKYAGNILAELAK